MCRELIWVVVLLGSIAIGTCLAPSAQAQVLPVGDPLEDYARLMQLAGRAPASSFAVRPLDAAFLLGGNAHAMPEDGAAEANVHPWSHLAAQYAPPSSRETYELAVLTPETEIHANSARPNGMNDGAVWQGRGLTWSASGGVFVAAGPVSASLRPRVTLAQNADFALSPIAVDSTFSEYAYANLSSARAELSSMIDWPQRFGGGSFADIDPGQSYIRVSYASLAAGISTENTWWGPGLRNAISMSNNAPGIPHAFVGTTRPADLRVAHVEGRWMWGKLYESDYFDRIEDNDERFFTSIVLAISPRFVPGLSIGATRTFMKGLRNAEIEGSDYFLVFENLFKKEQASPDNPSGLDELDQLITVFGRWLMPESGFEVYGEWAKGDHSWDMRDALVQFQHANGYTFGLQKVLEIDSKQWWRIGGEVTKLEAPKSDIVRGVIGGYFYQHWVVNQGYTHRGQLIGAAIGPASNSQYVAVDRFTPKGAMGGFIQRIVKDNDRYYRTEPGGESGHEVELALGFRGMRFVGGFEIEGSLAVEHLLNKYYVSRNDETNLHVSVRVRRAIGGYR